ncbi:MAG: HAMP domain-containing histidine kinase [Proteobacteria bacterium]|nr:MAG: HAMP domain-containing histidine kinase [Pseudomonadota bacterium]
MTFARKVFFAIFLSTLLVGSMLIWVSYSFFQNRAEEDFKDRYSSLTRVLSDTLTRLDVSTETLMKNAALVIADQDRRGLLTTDELRRLRNNLGITHAFVVDSNGDFITSTNEDPSQIPNLFDFNPEYKKLLTGERALEATPVIRPEPERTPFKFLSVPSFDRKRIIEVGIRVDFIANTLAEAVKSDNGVQSMTLYSPDGAKFGTFSAAGVIFDEAKAKLPSDLSQPIFEDSVAHFFSVVKSSHERCGQCDVAGTSINGKYYYVLESTVSMATLVSAQTLATKAAALFFLLNGFVSWFAASLISKRLSKNIDFAVARVRQISEGKSQVSRIGLQDGSEISYLTGEFDRLLANLEVSQQQALKAKMMKSRVELAKVVAHNIHSPVLALEMMIPLLAAVPENMKKVIKAAVDEIKSLAQDLKTSSADEQSALSQFRIEKFAVRDLISELLDQKRLEYAKTASFKLCEADDSKLEIAGNKVAIRGVLSNVINNAVEAYAHSSGEVLVEIAQRDSDCIVDVIDSGCGIESSKLALVGERSFSNKSGIGRGIGLIHAKSAVEASGGKVVVESSLGFGTRVSIRLPLAEPSLNY